MLYFWNVLITTRVKGTSRGEAPKLNAPYLKRETNEYCEAKKKGHLLLKSLFGLDLEYTIGESILIGI